MDKERTTGMRGVPRGLILVSAALAATAALAACNTMAGFGRDTQKAGHFIERKAQ